MQKVADEAFLSDSCHRCGLRRRTRELEENGIVIRLCDNCYWGSEPKIGEDADQTA